MVELSGIEVYVYLFCNAASIFMISLFMDIFFDRSELNCKRYLRALSYILYWAISSATYLFIQKSSEIMLLLTILGTSAISLTYKGSWKYRICSVITIIAVQIVCEDTIWILMVKVHAVQLFIVGLIAVQILTFMIAIILRKMVDLKKGEEILFGDWLSVTVIPIWSIFIAAIVLDGCENELAVAIGGISMILINFLVFYILNRMQSVYRKQLDVRVLEQQNKAYEYQMEALKTNEERISALHHDMKNHFLALDRLAEKGNNSEVRMYLKNLKEASGFESQFVSTGNGIIDGFLNVKLNEAIRDGAEVNTDIAISKDLRINPKDISIVLGNLLDNALQALKNIHGEGKQKYLTVKMREEPGMLYMRITNSHHETIKRKGDMFQSTKDRKDGHGIGLKNVSRIVDAYNGHLEIEYTDEMFSVELLLFL